MSQRNILKSEASTRERPSQLLGAEDAFFSQIHFFGFVPRNALVTNAEGLLGSGNIRAGRIFPDQV
ncbi:hypothetical protein [Mesorhizobium silamurunense]|uniref:hypothetical protein n=1 Tax=Mesorhizobium silamurunense TaxID=499528 RepID=UPI00178758EC|nr:hypothetical protein [Mesorhizobium silamurunense]